MHRQGDMVAWWIMPWLLFSSAVIALLTFWLVLALRRLDDPAHRSRTEE